MFLVSKDLEEFKNVLRDFLESKVNAEALKKVLLDGTRKDLKLSDADKKLWGEISELGVFQAGVAEAFGGLGLGALSFSHIMEECGRVLLPLPVLETLILGATPISLLGGDAAKKEYLPKVAEGALKLTGAFEGLFSLLNQERDFSENAFKDYSVKAQEKGGKWMVTGELYFVPSLEWSEGLVFLAKDRKGFRLCLKKEPGAPTKNYNFKLTRTLDLLRPFYAAEFKGEEVQVLSEEISFKALQSFIAGLVALVSSELVGVADKVMSTTVEYVKTRTQYDRPIGSFQAIQHKLADMKLALEEAASLVTFTNWAQEHSPEELLKSALAAKGFVSEVVPKLIEDSIQAHGGIGFTYEYELHLYLRRAVTQSTLFGARDTHYEILAGLELDQ